MGSSLVFLDDLDGNCQPAIFAGAYGDDADTGPLAGKKDIGGGWVIYLDDFNDVEKIPGTTNELSEYRPLAIPFASASQNNLTGEEGTFINAMSEVSVNPNPTEGVLYWQIDATEKNDVLVEMFDLLGNKVFKWEGIVENKHQQKADFSSLAAGQYLMKFVVGKQNITRVISVLN